jgi:iron complex outermembrane receptor protein
MFIFINDRYRRVKMKLSGITKAMTPLALAIGTLAPIANPVKAELLVLEETIVTARKKEESLQDTPVSVSAISGETLELKNVVSLSDLKSVPGVQLESGAGSPRTANFSIRGLSLIELDPSFEPAIAIIVDGVYYAGITSAVSALLDIESVEVLRGPQGTLFGRNSPAGVVNIRSRRPGDEFELNSSLTYSSWETTDARLAIGGPLIEDTLSARVAIMKRYSGDSYIDNKAPGFDDPNRDDTLYGRLSLLWTPSDALEISLIAEADDYEGTLGTMKNDSALPSAATFFAPPTPEGFYDVAMNIDVDAPSDSQTYIMNIGWDINDFTLTSISAYRETERFSDYDIDGTEGSLLHAPQSYETDQFTQELQVASSFDGPLNFIAGYFYMDATYSKHEEDTIYAPLSCLFIGAPLNCGLEFLNISDPSQDTESHAVFGQVYYDINESLRLTVGGRYSTDEKDFTVTFPAGQNFGQIVDESEDWSVFSPMASLDWHLTDSTMGYLSYSEGYRSGGFNGRANEVETFETGYDEEFSESIELGLKTELLDGRLRLNGALYKVEYTDQQLPDQNRTSQGVELSVVNAGSSEVLGLELEATWLASEHLTLFVDGAYMDAEYTDFTVDLNGDGTETDNSHFPLPLTPETKLHIGAQYDIVFSRLGELSFGVDWTFTDHMQTATVPVPNFTRRDSTDIVDANITWRPTENWRVTVFGKNLLDEEYISVGVAAGGGALSHIKTLAPPASYGITLAYDM